MAGSEKSKGEDNLSEEGLHWIVRLHSGRATPRDHRDYHEWRARSAAHEDAAVEAQALWDSMSRLHVDSSTGLVQLETAKRGYSRRNAMGAIVGIGFASAAGATFFRTEAFKRLKADYTSPTGHVREVALSDGTRVFMNARSALDVRFDPSFRRIFLLEGQAYFEVAPDKARPFVAMVDDISVVALGTAFDVTRALPGSAAEISVTQHSVRITPPGSARSQDIHAGQIVAVDGSGRIGQVRAQDPSIMASWRNGVYIAEETRLADVVAALSPWYPGMIICRDPSLEALTVNAVLDLKDPVSSLDALAEGLPIRVRHFSNYLAIISNA